MRRLLVLLIALTAFAHADTGYRIEPVADSLPWSIALLPLPDGDLLLAQRAGGLMRIHNGDSKGQPVTGVDELQAGDRPVLEMLDIALHPQFDSNRWLYVAYVTGEPRGSMIAYGNSEVRIARARYGMDRNGQASLEHVEHLFATPTIFSRPANLGGRLAFLDDGTLLLTSGDRSKLREQAQKIDSPVGKTLRLRDDGSVPPDNPFAARAGAYPYIWTLGHRNAQGLFYDRAANTVYSNEHGPQGGDELNRLRSGANYGWPLTTHGIDYSGGRITPFDAYSGTEQPLLHWEPSIAPSSLTQCRGCRWPAWDEDLFIGTLAGKHVRRVQLDNGRVVGQQVLFAELNERIRDVRFAADGSLYLLIDDRKAARVLRVVPAQ